MRSSYPLPRNPFLWLYFCCKTGGGGDGKGERKERIAQAGHIRYFDCRYKSDTSRMFALYLRDDFLRGHFIRQYQTENSKST